MQNSSDLTTGKRLFVGNGNPSNVLGVGPTEVRGSAYVEGPSVTGDPSVFRPSPHEMGTVMCGPTKNLDVSKVGAIPFHSLFVQTYARIKSFLKVDTLLSVKLIKSDIIYTNVLMANTKNFVIDHPTKENKKLVYGCLEGPEHSVYVRGRLTNNNVIELPEYWTNLVDETTITVSLTAIGAEQSLFVVKISNNKIVVGNYMTEFGELPIDCFYHVFGERKDVDKLQTEI
jgi:hypothetical protein